MRPRRTRVRFPAPPPLALAGVRSLVRALFVFAAGAAPAAGSDQDQPRAGRAQVQRSWTAAAGRGPCAGHWWFRVGAAATAQLPGALGVPPRRALRGGPGPTTGVCGGDVIAPVVPGTDAVERCGGHRRGAPWNVQGPRQVDPRSACCDLVARRGPFRSGRRSGGVPARGVRSSSSRRPRRAGSP